MRDSLSSVGFAATRWSLVEALRAADEGVRARAAETLARLYWGPIYTRLRRRGMGRDDAADLTQAFFAEVVLGRDLLERAAAERGRLRTLLLTALDRFAIDAKRRAAARGAGKHVPMERIESEEAALARGNGLAEGDAFDRRWALAVVEEAVSRCREHFVGQGRERHWRAFEARVLTPACHGVEARRLADVAAELGCRTPADAASMVQVVKDRLAAAVAEVLAEVGEAEDPRSLLQVLGA